MIGSYIADFFCHEARLVVEVDGSQHFSDEITTYDAERTAYFQSLGIRVVRVDNGQVNRDFPGVCAAILLELNQRGIQPVVEKEK